MIMTSNFEQPGMDKKPGIKQSKIETKENPEKESEKKEMVTAFLENLPPKTIFYLKGRKGRLVVVISKEKSVKNNVKVIWIDEPEGTVELIEGKTEVLIEEEEEEKPEWTETTLGEVKPHVEFHYQGRTGKILTKTSKDIGTWVRFKGQDTKDLLPWDTPVQIEKEKI